MAEGDLDFCELLEAARGVYDDDVPDLLVVRVGVEVDTDDAEDAS